ncbi:hypothetical protein E4T49_03820 [Aureobasidium sp. EXF-10728]|nr:hypothetical protein E4T49_03820 [Aureobasidium sp. EXF-10728]
MAELHKALEQLGPIDWADVPQDLGPFMKSLFETGELICNSVPTPPGGKAYDASQPTQPKPDTAKSSKDVVNSDARPVDPHPDQAALQKSWGKPIKLNAKDNPLGISVYKMAAKDRHGAWFARRQVLEGISLTKIRRAMQREFAESLSQSGGPGAGNVRGIGGDRRLDKNEVDGVGKMEALQLSAQFPGPTTPREFITLLLTSEDALSTKTSQDKHPIPRHYMVISKPLTHPDAPDREGYVKGSYESVEMIREIPLNPVPEKEGSADGDKHELNPVEWIMITRSEPGGGIPRFMVERGTPGSITADVSKFLDWACAKDEIPDADADEELQQKAQAEQAEKKGPPPAAQQNSQAQQPAQQPGGLIASITGAVEAGIEAYAPAPIANYTHNYMHPEDDTSDSSSSSDSSDADSFASAQDRQLDVGDHPAQHPAHDSRAVAASTTSLGAVSSPSSTTLPMGSTHHDKELRKIDKDRAKIEAKIHKKQDAEAVKLASHREKDPENVAKHQEKYDTAMAKLSEKREKELAKLEQKREKEISKAQRKRSVQLNRDEASRVARERDDFRHQVDMLKRENGLLREQMTDLQRENAMLVDKVNKLGGVGALKDIKTEAEQH